MLPCVAGTMKAPRRATPHSPAGVRRALAYAEELGVDLIFSIKRGIVAPKGTPKGIINYWANVLKKAAANEDLKKQMVAKGTGLQWVGPDDYQAWIDKSYGEFKTIADAMGWGKSN